MRRAAVLLDEGEMVVAALDPLAPGQLPVDDDAGEFRLDVNIDGFGNFGRFMWGIFVMIGLAGDEFFRGVIETSPGIEILDDGIGEEAIVVAPHVLLRTRCGIALDKLLDFLAARGT